METTLTLAKRECAKYGVEADFIMDTSLPSYEVRAMAGRLVIAAPNDVELLYGVYACAETYGGYTFFEPGRDIFAPERVMKELPKQNGVLLPARRPLLKIRGFIQEFPFGDDTAIIFDWMAKNALNYLLVWMKYYDHLSDEMKEYARIRGIEIESGHHNFNYWIPGSKYAAAHPDFFAMIDGKRISPSGNAELLLSEQLCTTNPELRAEIVRRMLEYGDEHPEIHTISLTPNDGFGWCECPECSKFYDRNCKGDLYSVSTHVYKADRIYHDLVRDIAARLHAARPSLKLTFTSYINYCRPSKGMTLEPGMAVHMAPYWHCINHALDDADCPINSHYAADLLAWSGVKHGGEIYVYEYYMGVNFYLSLPMVHFHEMFREMRWYAAHGVDGVNTQFHVSHWTVYGMNYYLMARAARGADEESTITDMFVRLFGKDAEVARAFYRAVKKVVLSVGKCHIPYPRSLFSRTKLEDYKCLYTKAKDLLALQPSDALRKEIALWMEFICMFKAFFDLNQQHKATESDAQALLDWIHSHRDTRLFVHDRFDMYFDEVKTLLREGRPWIHFGIDWEDAIILREEKEYFGK